MNNNNGSSIHSGHYMTSYLHDQNEDTVEMPIASPDASIHDVTPLNTDLNAEQYQDQENETLANANTSNATINQTIGQNSLTPNTITQSATIGNSVMIRNGTANSSSVRKVTLNGPIHTIQMMTSSGCSISGGLTLDKTNKSLKNLMYYIKTAYSNNLTSPKWKSFKGLKLQVTEKIRLNNVIWRSWFEQYGTKDTSKRRIRLICQFANGLDEQPPVTTKMSAKEGKFWKARLETITNEYKKWREISRKQIKLSNDGLENENLLNLIKKKKIEISASTTLTKNLTNGQFENQSSSVQTTVNNSSDINIMYPNTPSSFYTNTAFNNYTSNFNNIQQPQQSNNLQTNTYFYANNFGLNVTEQLNPNEFSIQSTDNFTGFNTSSNSNLPGIVNYSANTSFNNNNNNNNIQQSFGNQNTSLGAKNPVIPTTSSFTTSLSATTSYQNFPIASKQMAYNNRCRSPSPGLFQDFDLYNFSSDTLFSTYPVEDPKDTIFGTNPDFFQPDLMHLYPNFDFFDLPDTNVVFSNESETNRKQSPPAIEINTAPNGNSSSYTTTAQSRPVVQEIQVVQESQDGKQQIMSIDYSDLSNFNTLATVAAAQSLNNSPNNNGNNIQQQNRPQKQRHMSEITLKSSTNQIHQSILNDPSHQLKLQTSLSQINSNPIQQFNNNNHISRSNSSNSNNISSTSPSSSSNSINLASSNTIRNLLALNSSSSSSASSSSLNLPSSKSTPNHASPGLRLSTGVLAASGSSISTPNRKLQQQNIFYQAQSTSNQQPQQRVISPPSQGANTIPVQSSPQNKAKIISDSQSVSTLLSAVLGQPSNQTEISISQLLPNFQAEQLMEQISKPPPNKRGRKSNAESAANQTKITNPRASQSRGLSQTKSKKDEAQIQIINETSDNSVNSPINSPNNSNSNFNSTYNNSFQSQMQPNFQNADSNSSEFSLLSKYQRVNSSQSASKVNELFAPNSVDTTRMSRSNSVNSLNDTSLTTAEQKRRCNIQHGFDRLQVLVPSLREGKNLKVSKAVMLQKTSEYIKELQLARDKRLSDLDVYKKEIEDLSDKITECQNQLPASGVSVVGNLNKAEKFEQKFNSYVKEKTLENWKFYLFSLILKPLFDNFIQTLNTSSKEDMERTFYEWQQKFCNLTQLRPMTLNALRGLSKSTSILTDSAKLAEECYSAALTKV